MKLASQYAGFGRQAASAEDWMAEQYLAAKREEAKLMAEQRLAPKSALEEKKAAGCSADLFAPKRAEEEKMAEQHLAAKRAVEEKLMAEQHLAAKRAAAKDWMAELHLAAKREEKKLMATLFPMPAAAAAEGETKPARKTKMVRVKQEYINWLLARPPPKPYTGLSDELIDKFPNAALRAKMRVVYRDTAERMKALRARDADILEQYRTKGYAEVEEEVTEEEAVDTVAN